MTGSPEGKDGNTKASNTLRALAGHEAIFLAALTGLAYIGAFYIQLSYLSYFGISPAFVEIDLIRIIASMAALFSFAVVIYNFLNLIPISLLRLSAQAILLFAGPLLLSFLGGLIVVYSGFNWWSVGLLVGALATLLILHSGQIISLLRRRETWKQTFDDALSSELKFRSHLIGPRFMDVLPVSVVLGMLGLVAVVPIVGNLAGSGYAARQRTHSLVDYDSKRYIIVSSYKDGMIAAQVVEEGSAYTLTGNSRLFSTNQLESVEMTRVYQKFRRFESRNGTRWVGPFEFFEDVFGTNGAEPGP